MSRQHRVWLLVLLMVGCAPVPTVIQQRPSMERLEPNFKGDDPWQVVTQIRSGIPKFDQYTSDAEKARLYESVGSMRVLKFVRSCHKKYQPEQQAWEFSIIPSQRSSRLTLNLVSQDKSKDMYSGSNAFGATTTVVKVETDKIDIGWERGSGQEPNFAATGRPAMYAYTFFVKMDTNEARQNEQDIDCLILFQPTPPFLDNYTQSSTPTFSSPLDVTWRGTIIIGRFLELWVFNKRTGTVYARLN